MPYTPFYDPTGWEDDPSTDTPITAEALNYIEAGIETAQQTAEDADPSTSDIWDAKGDLLVGTGPDAATIKGVGSDNTVLAASGGETTGVIWKKVGNAMVADDAAIAVSKLAPGSASQILATSSGSAQWIANPGIVVLDRLTTNVDVTATTAETTLYTYSVPGGTLGTTRILRLTLMGDYNYVVGHNVTIRFKYGATTMSTVVLSAANVNAATKGWRFHYELIADDATNAQTVIGHGNGGEAEMASANIGSMEHSEEMALNMYGTATEDSTAAKSITVTAQWNSNSGSLHWKIRSAYLEHI